PYPDRSAGVPKHSGEYRTSRRGSSQFHDHEPAYAERLLRTGELRDRAADRRAQHVERRIPASARAAPDRLNQPERPGLRGGGEQQRLPPESELREQQPVFSAGGLLLRRPARLVHAAPGAMGELP